MQSLEMIKSILDEKNIKNNIDNLPNGKSVLTLECNGESSTWTIFVEETAKNGKQIRLYAIVAPTCKDAKYNVCRIINDYNKKYDYVKFFYQESEQGEFVFASYSIPSLDEGLTYFFKKVLIEFVSVLDDVICSIPMNVFNGQVKSWYFPDNETDFTKIISGRVYGTNSRKIYEKFCETLNWDKSKANQFGFRTPLYAENADTYRENDVWFICYPNFDANKLDCVVDDKHVINLIKDNGEKIVEIVEDRFGKSNNANRITFIKTINGYEFLGVYEIVENGTTRIYKRISKTYPID